MNLLICIVNNSRINAKFIVTNKIFFITETQSSDEGETYYIIHPVLKHLAILSK